MQSLYQSNYQDVKKGSSVMEMQQHHHQNPVTTIVQHVEKDAKKLELPLEKVEHKVSHLKESIDKKIDEKALPVEENIINKILRDPNTEKLIKYTLNSPDAKKIFEDVAKEELQELRQDFAKSLKNLEDNVSQDLKQIRQNLIYAGCSITIVALALLAYAY